LERESHPAVEGLCWLQVEMTQWCVCGPRTHFRASGRRCPSLRPTNERLKRVLGRPSGTVTFPCHEGYLDIALGVLLRTRRAGARIQHVADQPGALGRDGALDRLSPHLRGTALHLDQLLSKHSVAHLAHAPARAHAQLRRSSSTSTTLE
jgi:hypothetical protein